MVRNWRGEVDRESLHFVESQFTDTFVGNGDVLVTFYHRVTWCMSSDLPGKFYWKNRRTKRLCIVVRLSEITRQTPNLRALNIHSLLLKPIDVCITLAGDPTAHQGSHWCTLYSLGECASLAEALERKGPSSFLLISHWPDPGVVAGMEGPQHFLQGGPSWGLPKRPRIAGTNNASHSGTAISWDQWGKGRRY